MPEDITAAKHDAYARIHASDDFALLRRRFRAFVVPATLVFMGWYLLYVVMSNYAHDFMSEQVVGNINVALVFGLLQFASTFLIAFLYSRFANRELDPIGARLAAQYDEEISR